MINYNNFRRDALESEEIVSDLVNGFLLPEVQKATIRERGNLYYDLLM